MKQLVRGLQDVQSLNIVHRDMKLANVLLHFPDKPQIEQLTGTMKKQFLRKVDLTKVNFQVKISDWGLSTIMNENKS